MNSLTITRSPAPFPVIDHDAEVWRDAEGVICAYGRIVGDDCWMHLPGVATFRIDREPSKQCVAFANGTDDSIILDAYRRRVLPMELHVKGWEVMHASGVRAPAGVIAFCAPSETGKSTIACALGCRGYTLWADDALAFSASEKGIATCSLPFEMRLRSSAAALLSDCHKNALPAPNGDSEGQEAPLAAICVLRRSTNGGPVSIRQLHSAEALEAVLPHSWCFTLRDVNRKRQMMDSYLDLAARTTIFDVCFQPGLENLPFVLDSIEENILSLTQ